MTLSQVLMRTVFLTVIFLHLNVWSSDEDRVKLCHEDVAGKGFDARHEHLHPCRVPCGLCWEMAWVSGLFHSQSQPQWAWRAKSPSCALKAIILFTGLIEMYSFIMHLSCSQSENSPSPTMEGNAGPWLWDRGCFLSFISCESWTNMELHSLGLSFHDSELG